MVIDEIQSDLDAIEDDASLYEEANFNSRVEAIDDIEFKVIERIEGLLPAVDARQELETLKREAERLKSRLAAVDDALFRRLRADIRAGICIGTALREQIGRYTSPGAASGRDRGGYDNLDVFVNGLLRINLVPVETRERELEMVAYQPTPTRIILEMVEQAHLTTSDLFYDLGSGLGHVPILVHLLSRARAKGIEIEPSFCDYARACAAELELAQVEFINADVREVEVSDGTVFFMYTPFEGAMLEQVLDKLRSESREHSIRLFTYGPCTPIVSQQSWLKTIGQPGDHICKLAAFTSR